MNLLTKCHKARPAWTLIEMIGTLALIGILAGVCLPVLVRHTDKVVADQEVATLKSFRDAFLQYVLATRFIPDHTTWYSAIASKLGFGTNDVLYNVRQQARKVANSRVFLIDPALRVGQPAPTAGLPYSQATWCLTNANASMPMLPQNPRLMIVSSLGRPLPATVVSGVFSAGHPEYFADLWNAQDGTVPSDAPWIGWAGNPGDVIVQRVNLEPLFIHLLLSRYNSTANGSYTIDGNDGTTSPLQVAASVDGYFIQNTVLTLYTNNPNDQVHAINAKQILTADSSFVFEEGIWRGSLTGASTGNGAANAGDVVQAFLNATPNVNSMNPYTNLQQTLIVSNMLTYMSNYNYYAYNTGFKNNTLQKYLQDLESKSLMPAIWGIYVNNYSNNGCCFPTNPTSINCP